MKIITGADLKRIRLLSGKTPHDIALAVNKKSNKTIIHWEDERSEPGVNDLLVLIMFCDFRPHEVVRFCMERSNKEERIPESFKVV